MMSLVHKPNRALRLSTLAVLLLLSCTLLAAPAAASPRRMMLDANATSPSAPEEGSVTTASGAPEAANATVPAVPEEVDAIAPAMPEEATATSPAMPEQAENRTAAPAASPDLQELHHSLGAPSPLVGGRNLTDKVTDLVNAYCQKMGKTCYTIQLTGLTFVDDGFTPVKLSPPRLSQVAYASMACTASNVPYKCSLDVAIEAERKATSTTTDGYAVDGRVG